MVIDDEEEIKDREINTIILCGIIGYRQHIQVVISIKLSLILNEDSVELYKKYWTPQYLNETIGHCEHVKQFLLDGTWQI